ncbi:MAG: SDR family NAD(P)-dependent oxidoreductase [Lachnospiraceae bacterium]|nr:SDR family NAD(P)-dependent oxidoreductase [Lachnospiraceae bacterium]
MSKRIAIITGATGGIGREFTRLLVEEDIDEVWTVARNEKKLEEV